MKRPDKEEVGRVISRSRASLRESVQEFLEFGFIDQETILATIIHNYVVFYAVDVELLEESLEELRKMQAERKEEYYEAAAAAKN